MEAIASRLEAVATRSKKLLVTTQLVQQTANHSDLAVDPLKKVRH